MLKITCFSLGLLSLSACSTAPQHLGPQQTQLSNCPDSPNCISSVNYGAWHMHDKNDWQKTLLTLAELPNTRLETSSESYAHFVVTSNWMGFKDDVELMRINDHIEYRSASRSGYYDFGVNLQRMQMWQRKLQDENLLAR